MNKTILFAEDEQALRNTMIDFLKNDGFEVLSAQDGEEALKIIKTKKIDLVLLDLILPKKDGFEVLTELKQDEKTKHIPVIVLTNLEGSGDIERAIATGATTYLVKANYNPEEVIRKIKTILK